MRDALRGAAAAPGAWLVLLLLLFAAIVWRFHYGYIPYADQDFAIRGILGWVEAFPYLGTTHWELRHPFIWASAISVALFGVSEWSLHLPVALAGAAAVGVFFLLMRRISTLRAAVLASLVAATAPLVCYTSTILYPDIFEALFGLLGLWLYLRYLAGAEARSSLFLVGVTLGLAFLVRETAVQFVAALGLFYLIAVRRDFLTHLLAALGFLLVVSFDLSFGYLRHGDPFYRYVIDLQANVPMDYWSRTPVLSPTFDNPEEVAAAYDPASAPPVVLGVYGTVPGPVSVHPAIDRYTLFFLNHEYGGVFFGLVVAAVLAGVARARPGAAHHGTILLLCLLVASVVVINYVAGLRPLPRYYLITVLASAGLLGLLLDALLRQRRRWPVWLAWATLAMVLSGNLLGLDLRTPRLVGERLLAANPWGLEAPIHVDPQSQKMARFFLELEERPPEVRTAPPPPGGYYLYISDSTDRRTARSDFRAGPDWQEVWRLPTQERWAGRLLRLAGLEGFVPDGIYQQLLRPDSDVVLYRIPEAPAATD